MTGREHIIALASAYGHALGLERTTVSWRLFQDTNKLDAIIAGKDLYLGRYERAMQWFSDHWPEIDWPVGVPRPEPQPAAPAEPARVPA